MCVRVHPPFCKPRPQRFIVPARVPLILPAPEIRAALVHDIDRASLNHVAGILARRIRREVRS